MKIFSKYYFIVVFDNGDRYLSDVFDPMENIVIANVIAGQRSAL